MPFEEYIQSLNITVTPLRKDILATLWQNQKPLKAYTILNSLKQHRPSAKPPTVYRVLDFLVQEDIVHRIEATQSYVICSHQAQQEQSKHILMVCNKCKHISEISDNDLQLSINNIAKNNEFKVSSSVIELYGICKLCLQS